MKTFKNRNLALTLAEVLITLVIIGVVAVLIVPVLIDKIRDNLYEIAKTRVISTVGEAGKILTLQGDISSAADAEDFVKNYLSKKIQIIKTCSGDNLQACGFDTNFQAFDGTSINMPTRISQLGIRSFNAPKTNEIKDKPSYGFITNNGYSINLFYNPGCIPDEKESQTWLVPDYICLNIIYDINGLKKPNKVGKDIGFMTLFYPDETVTTVFPTPALLGNETLNWAEARSLCKKDGYRLPNVNELISIAYNSKLLGANGSYSTSYWTDITDPNLTYARFLVDFERMLKSRNATAAEHNVLCIK